MVLYDYQKANTLEQWVGAKQHVHWFLGGKGLGIQQETSVWVGSPKSPEQRVVLYDYQREITPEQRVGGETTYTLVPWRQKFKHPTRNERMGWFAQVTGAACGPL